MESETSLDHIANEIDEEDVYEGDEPDNFELDPNFIDTVEDKGDVLLQKFSLDYMKHVIDYNDEKDPATGKRRRSFKSVKHRFRRVTDFRYLSRFRLYIEKGGTRKNKLENINNYVYDKFEQARESLLPVHDIDLHRWSLQQAAQESLHDFVASEKWLFNFKVQHNICSGKVTKVIEFFLLFFRW